MTRNSQWFHVAYSERKQQHYWAAESEVKSCFSSPLALFKNLKISTQIGTVPRRNKHRFGLGLWCKRLRHMIVRSQLRPKMRKPGQLGSTRGEKWASLMNRSLLRAFQISQSQACIKWCKRFFTLKKLKLKFTGKDSKLISKQRNQTFESSFNANKTK